MANGGGVARVGDMVTCVCTVHGPTVGFFEVGDDVNLTEGSPTIRVGDIVVCECGHAAKVGIGSINYNSSTIPVARLGDPVIPAVGGIGPYGTVTTCSSLTFNYDNPPPAREVPAEVAAVIPPESIQPEATFYDAVNYAIPEDVGDPDVFEQGTPTAAEATAISYVGVVVNNTPPVAQDQVNTAPPVEDVPPVNGGTISVDCQLIPDDVQSTFRLSDHYNLASLSTNTAVSNYAVRDQTANGIFYSKKQIVCNLSKLATQLLEPIGAQFGKPLVTSAFRHGTNASNHNKGCAADIQWPELNGDEQEYFNRINWIKDNLIWNELILEYGGRAGPWLHVSYQDYGPRPNNRYNFKTLKSLAGGGTYDYGVFVLYNNVPGVGGR